MSRKHHDELDEAAGATGGGVGNGKAAVWDTGSSLYDSYELAAVRRLLDKRLLLAAAAAGGVLPLRDDEPPPPPAAGETMRGEKRRQVVIVPVTISRVHVHHRKVTMRALFRAVATWAGRARPRQAPQLACACAGGTVHDQSGSAAVEPDLLSHGQL